MEEPQVQLDYLELVNPDTFEPLETACASALAVVAARVGNTRLLDNIVLT